MKRNKNIEMLRALAIIYMLLYHYMQSIPGIISGNIQSTLVESLGQFALISFFVLSGFGTYLSFNNMEIEGKSLYFSSYVKRRLRAILPQYYFCIIFVLLFTTGIGFFSWSHWRHLLESLFLVQNYDLNNGINGVTWTIAVLFQLYLIAIPLYNLAKKYGFISWGIALLISVCIKRILFFCISTSEINEFYYVMTSIRIPFTTIDLILCGMCMARLCLRMKEKYYRVLMQKKNIFICVSMLVLFHYLFELFVRRGGTLYGNYWISSVWQSAIGIYIAIMCLFLYFLPFLYRSRIGKIVQYVAKYEYGTYLWHMILMGNFMTFLPDWYVVLRDTEPYCLMLIMIFMAFFVGVVSTKLAASPAYQKMFEWLKEKNATA